MVSTTLSIEYIDYSELFIDISCILLIQLSYMHFIACHVMSFHACTQYHPMIHANFWVKPPCESKPWEIFCVAESHFMIFMSFHFIHSIKQPIIVPTPSFTFSFSRYLSAFLPFFLFFRLSVFLSFLSFFSLCVSLSKKVHGRNTWCCWLFWKNKSHHHAFAHSFLPISSTALRVHLEGFTKHVCIGAHGTNNRVSLLKY